MHRLCIAQISIITQHNFKNNDTFKQISYQYLTKFDIKRTNKREKKYLVFHCESCLSQMKCWGVMQSTRATLNPVLFSRARQPLCWLVDSSIPEKLDLVGSVALNWSKFAYWSPISSVPGDPPKYQPSRIRRRCIHLNSKISCLF